MLRFIANLMVSPHALGHEPQLLTQQPSSERTRINPEGLRTTSWVYNYRIKSASPREACFELLPILRHEFDCKQLSLSSPQRVSPGY